MTIAYFQCELPISMTSQRSESKLLGEQDAGFDRRGVIGLVAEGGQLDRLARFLVIRRSRHVIAPLTYCFPGGGIEDGESQSEALVREFREELNVEVVPGAKFWESVTPWNVHLVWWTASLQEGAVIRPNPEEVESFHWMTVEEMLNEPQTLESNLPLLTGLKEGRIKLSR